MHRMLRSASVVDLFAGPGGLGEGFSAFSPDGDDYPFRIEMSVEKEQSAHKTLELRAFFRQFRSGVPDQYYRYLRGEISRLQLFEDFPQQRARAAIETLGSPRALGDSDDDSLIYRRLRALRKRSEPIVDNDETRDLGAGGHVAIEGASQMGHSFEFVCEGCGYSAERSLS